MERDQASMPPERDWAWVKPWSRNHKATLRERAPWWHMTTMGASGSSSAWAREATSPVGRGREVGMLAVWYSQGSRTSNRRGASGCRRCSAKAAGMISSSSMNSRIYPYRGPGHVLWVGDETAMPLEIFGCRGSLRLRTQLSGLHLTYHAFNSLLVERGTVLDNLLDNVLEKVLIVEDEVHARSGVTELVGSG